MNTVQKQIGSFLVGGYAWIITIFFGMILLDITYARLVPGAAGAFSKVSDLLLFVGFIALLSAAAAIAFSWNAKTARNLLIASLLVTLFEFLIPAFFSLFALNTAALHIGPWLRILPVGIASILAFLGGYRYAV